MVELAFALRRRNLFKHIDRAILRARAAHNVQELAASVAEMSSGKTQFGEADGKGARAQRGGRILCGADGEFARGSLRRKDKPITSGYKPVSVNSEIQTR